MSGYLLYVGLGDITRKELSKLSNHELKDDIPLLETKVFDFEARSSALIMFKIYNYKFYNFDPNIFYIEN